MTQHHGRRRPDPPAARRVSARVGGIAESATLAVDAKAKAKKAAGEDVVGFGAGEPDFPTPAGDRRGRRGRPAASPRNHRYTPAGGLPELKQAIAAKTLRDSGYDVTAAQVLVTNGGKQAVYEAFATLLDPGDEVLLPAPYWTTYPEAIRLAGGVPVDVVTTEDQGYRVTVEQLEAARTERTKVLLWCSPSNPTGAVASPDEVEAVGRWAVEHGIWVVADEIYEHLVYGDARARLDAGRRARARRHLRGRQRRGQDLRHDRLAGRLADRPARRRQGGHQPAVARHLQRQQRRPGRGAGGRHGDLSAVAEMRAAFDRRRQTMVRLLDAIPGVDLPGAARAPSTATRRSRACWARRCAAARRRPRPSWPSWSWTRSAWPWCRARRSGRPATSGCRTRWATPTSRRASRRMADLLAEAQRSRLSAAGAGPRGRGSAAGSGRRSSSTPGRGIAGSLSW